MGQNSFEQPFDPADWAPEHDGEILSDGRDAERVEMPEEIEYPGGTN